MDLDREVFQLAELGARFDSTFFDSHRGRILENRSDYQGISRPPQAGSPGQNLEGTRWEFHRKSLYFEAFEIYRRLADMPKLTFCGHSCALVESSACNVIIDPFLTGNPTASHQPEDIPPLAAVLLTHGHGDHVGDGIHLAKRNRATVVATYELATYCESEGCEAISMNVGGAADLSFGRVKLVQAWHSSSFQVGDRFIYMGMPTGILYSVEGKTLYHLGDTGLFSDLELIGKWNGPIDVALIPIGDHYTMGIDEAVEASRLVGAKTVVPIHYNTFPPIECDPTEFADKVAKAGGKAVVLKPGESMEY
jgi:L-ascorbate metabolism protein UlaG (beta-lactamase superfamily)